MERESLYFEPRVIDENGVIRWYGERYHSQTTLLHTEQTVYIRDSGKELLVYKLDEDGFQPKTDEVQERIEAVFTLLCRLPKYRTGFRYGRKIK